MPIHRSGWIYALFCIGFALLVCHELDAVARHEWRLLPVLNLLPDQAGYFAFVILHVPVFAALFWLTGHTSSIIRTRSQMALDAFLIIHAGLHFALSGHALYEFDNQLSNALIFGGAAAGLAHLVLLYPMRGRA